MYAEKQIHVKQFGDQDITEFPNVARWLDALSQRPGVQRGMALFREKRRNFAKVDTAQEQLFGQRNSSQKTALSVCLYKKGYRPSA